MQTQMRFRARRRGSLGGPLGTRQPSQPAPWLSGRWWGWRRCGLWHPFLPGPLVEETIGLAPTVDLYEEPDEVVVKVDIPGLEQDDLIISLNDSLLTIAGERKYALESEGREYSIHERVAGDFCRSLWLPATVDGEKAQASYRQGVLEIHLPKAPEAKGKKITIAAS